MEARFEGIVIKFTFDIVYIGGLLRLLLALFTLVRFTDFLIIDDGPDNIFLKFRLWFSSIGGNFKKLIECPYCLAVWLAIPISVLYFVQVPLTDFILFVFGISGLQILVEDSRRS